MKTRRDFIKISALGTAGATLAGSMLSFGRSSSPLDELNNSKKPFKKLNRYPTYCEVCFWKCAGWT